MENNKAMSALFMFSKIKIMIMRSTAISLKYFHYNVYTF